MSTEQSVYTSRLYEMEPEFEDLIFGSELKDGMIVLIEDSLTKGDPDRIASDTHGYDTARCREANRWCTVDKLRRHSGELVTFVGVYADGTKKVRTYNQSYAWFVKKETM